MKRLAYIAVTLTILAVLQAIAHGQTISPLNAECSAKHCLGTFSVTNNGIQPMTVTITPVSLTINANGDAAFRPLDPTTEVTLNAMSARLSPKQTYVVDYKIKCQQTPCMVDFAASMMAGHTNDGVGVRIILNHIVYACDKTKDCRVGILKSVGYLQ